MSKILTWLFLLVCTVDFCCCQIDPNGVPFCTLQWELCKTKHTVIGPNDLDMNQNEHDYCVCEESRLCSHNWGQVDEIISATVTRSNYTSVRYFRTCGSLRDKRICNSTELSISFSKTFDLLLSWTFYCRCPTNTEYILKASYLQDGFYHQKYGCQSTTPVCQNIHACKVRAFSGADAVFTYPCVCPSGTRCGRLTTPVPNNRIGARCIPHPPAHESDPDELHQCSYYPDGDN